MVKVLESSLEHRAVALPQQSNRDVDHALRVDSEEVAVVCAVVDRAERNAVDHRGDALGSVSRMMWEASIRSGSRNAHTAHRSL
jgi:hypothetical protein